MIVEVLYFEGCPNHVHAGALVEEILSELDISAEIRFVEVTDEANAQAMRFLGSPTVRVDGVDVDQSSAKVDHFGFMCRLYRQGGSSSGVPPREIIESALATAALRRKGADVS